MEANREAVFEGLRDDVSRRSEDRLERFAGLFLVPVEDGLYQSSQPALRPVRRQLDAVHQHLAFALELHDLVGLQDLLDRHALRQVLDALGETLLFRFVLSDEPIEFGWE